MQNWWTTDVKYIKGVGPAKAALLAKLGIFTIGNLLEHYPRRYEDRSHLKLIAELTAGQVETFRAVVIGVDETRPRRGLTIIKLIVRDASGLAQLVWFNQPFVKKWYKEGMELVITGKVERRYRSAQVANPEIEIIDGTDMLNTGRIVPIYPASENVSQRLLRTLIRQVLNMKEPIAETLPAGIIEHYRLVSRSEAIENIHFPDDMHKQQLARRRLAFEELFLLQCGLLYIKHKYKHQRLGVKHGPDGELLKKVEQNLPFQLTTDQRQVLEDIKADMQDTKPMQRLVQGDVGSGKTIVAALALVKTVENGYQGAMMAPTEILAEQHYHTLAKLLAPVGIRLAVLTGKLTKKTRAEVLDRIRKGLVDIVIGTHALIQEDVEFAHLGLVVTDEQHRFGVRQRAALSEKAKLQPDVLVMTATPIPRTMALTVYGDLDVSLIRQLPPGRKPIRTFVRSSDRRDKVYQFVVNEIRKGRQAYVVCPLVEESEKVAAQSATKLYDELSETYFTGIPCGLVHGKLKPKEKDAVMDAFYRAELKVLVATTVIEVGVNVPNASVMVIEGAERFGLAQLHQLRGRIGRGEYQSYCILLSDSKGEDTQERLGIMAETNDGFVLAEKDLLLRGPGQFFGTRQHGMPDLKIADIIHDTDILIEARRAAQYIITVHGELERIKPALAAWFGEQFNMIFNN